MAVGDDAIEAGWSLVPNTGDLGKVKLGAQEINRTRDYAAQVKASIPVGHTGYQAAAGITIGAPGVPPDNADGADHDIYLMPLSS
jgi:hypothetical protein